MDCDVEEPDCHVFLPLSESDCEEVSLLVPQVDAKLCDGCGECSAFCQYHAIAKLGRAAMTFPELCHSCGGCAKVCPKGAIKEVPRRIGEISAWSAERIRLMQGLMDIGNPAAPPLIRALKKKASAIDSDLILDCPPGASCPAATTVRGCDFALLVCEPTPFGVHDMSIAAKMLKSMSIPFAAVINKSGESDDLAERLCFAGGIEILGRLEECLETARLLSKGGLLSKSSPKHMRFFERLAMRIRGHAFEMKGGSGGKAV